jgi:zinc transport system substrate-binding protein
MKRTIILFVVILAALFFGGNWLFQNKEETKEIDQKMSVVASFYPIAFFSSEIGGYKTIVTNLTPSGVEPHDYEPTTKDLALLEQSRVVVLNGGVEVWADKVKSNLEDKQINIITAGEGIINKEIEEDGKKIADPHIWLDPVLAKEEAQKIAEGFAQADPQNQSYYENSLSLLNDKFDQLNQKYKMGLSNCQKKDIITSHTAFGYLAARYGLNQVAIAGLSPESEPSLQQLADISEFAKENNVKYIFFENLVSPKLSETIASEVGAKTLVLDPLESLSEDDSKQGKNYFTVMEDNLKNLQLALGCHQ